MQHIDCTMPTMMFFVCFFLGGGGGGGGGGDDRQYSVSKVPLV